jgi:hypothetical protein
LIGAGDDEVQRVVSVVAAFLPFNRAITIDDEVLAAARIGDAALVRMLLAEEVESERDEVAALEAADHGDDGRRFTAGDIRQRLGL